MIVFHIRNIVPSTATVALASADANGALKVSFFMRCEAIAISHDASVSAHTGSPIHGSVPDRSLFAYRLGSIPKQFSRRSKNKGFPIRSYRCAAPRHCSVPRGLLSLIYSRGPLGQIQCTAIEQQDGEFSCFVVVLAEACYDFHTFQQSLCLGCWSDCVGAKLFSCQPMIPVLRNDQSLVEWSEVPLRRIPS